MRSKRWMNKYSDITNILITFSLHACISFSQVLKLGIKIFKSYGLEIKCFTESTSSIPNSLKVLKELNRKFYYKSHSSTKNRTCKTITSLITHHFNMTFCN